MNVKVLTLIIFTAIFGSLLFGQVQKVDGKLILPTPTPYPTTSPISYPTHILSGNVSFRFFSLIKGWLTVPASHVSLTATSQQLKIGVIIITDNRGNYSIKLQQSAWNVAPVTRTNIRYSPTGYFIILNNDVKNINFVGTPIHIGY